MQRDGLKRYNIPYLGLHSIQFMRNVKEAIYKTSVERRWKTKNVCNVVKNLC